MSDDDLVAKFSAMSDPVLGQDKTRKLLDACWGLAGAEDVRALVAHAMGR
jgi:hypothetical protein